MKRVIGGAMLSVPFLLLIAGMVLDKGVLVAVVTWAVVVILCGLIVGGISLIVGD